MISSSLALYLSFIPQFITAYICSISVIRDILTTYQINQLFSHCDVHLQPLHPDNAAGFGFIGSFFQRFTIIVIAIGMWISIYNFLVPTLQNRPINLGWEILLTAALYLIVAPTSLILPLWSTHLAMKKEKDRLIASISEQFDKEFCVMPANISDSTKALRQWLDKTKALEDTKKVVENTLHTWPVSNRALREFSLSASLPIITSLVSLFIEFF